MSEIKPDPKQPKPPRDLKPNGDGRRFWREILKTYTLRADELVLLAEAARQLDLLQQLRERIAIDGPVIEHESAGLRSHPAVVESRQCRTELRRCLSQLGLPNIEPDAEAKPIAEIQWIREGPADRDELKRHRHDPRVGKRSRRAAQRGEQRR